MSATLNNPMPVINVPQIEPFEWEVVERPIVSDNKIINGYKAIFRNDTNGLLNVTKSSYTPTPNSRFLEVVDKMNKITGFPIRSYDEFEGGKKVLAYLECTEPIEVQGHEFKDYMLIGNSHDSSTGFFMGNSSEMVRCKNRFSKVFRQLQVNHTRNHDVKIEQLMQYFQSFMNERKAMFTKMNQFAKVKIDDSVKESLYQRLAQMTNEEIIGSAEISTRKNNIVNDMKISINNECSDLGDNLFGLFNGITYYTTHVKKAKEQGFGNSFGSIAKMNADAFAFCEAY
jgi:hypothetical protein